MKLTSGPEDISYARPTPLSLLPASAFSPSVKNARTTRGGHFSLKTCLGPSGHPTIMMGAGKVLAPTRYQTSSRNGIMMAGLSSTRHLSVAKTFSDLPASFRHRFSLLTSQSAMPLFMIWCSVFTSVPTALPVNGSPPASVRYQTKTSAKRLVSFTTPESVHSARPVS